MGRDKIRRVGDVDRHVEERLCGRDKFREWGLGPESCVLPYGGGGECGEAVTASFVVAAEV